MSQISKSLDDAPYDFTLLKWQNYDYDLEISDVRRPTFRNFFVKPHLTVNRGVLYNRLLVRFSRHQCNKSPIHLLKLESKYDGLKGHSHEKMHMFFWPILQKIINKKYFQYTSSQNFLWQRCYLDEWFVSFSNHIYNLCMPRVLIMLFIHVIVTGVLVMCSNL